MDAKLKEQKPPKANILLWKDVSYHEMEEISKGQRVADLESSLSRLLQVDVPEPRKGVLLELYVHSVLFSRENGFNKEQTSAVLSIIKAIHEVNIKTSLDNMEDCSEFCKELLLRHSVRRPPFSMNLFSLEEATRVLQYIHRSYITHAKLYKYVFTLQEKLHLQFSYAGGSEESILPAEDSAVPEPPPDVAIVTEMELPQTERSESSNVEREGAALGSVSQLRALIEQEVRKQMMLLSEKLDQQMEEIAAQQNNAPESTQQQQNIAP